MAILRWNNIIFVGLMVVGVVLVIGKLVGVPLSQGQSCVEGDIMIKPERYDAQILSVEPYKNDSIIVNLGSELLIVDVCNNKIVKRVMIQRPGVESSHKWQEGFR